MLQRVVSRTGVGISPPQPLKFAVMMAMLFSSAQSLVARRPSALQGGPHLTITATTPTAFETGSAEAVFSVTRDGPTTQPFTVRLNISGTATNGSDYTTIPSEIQIPAGATKAEIRIRPIDDSQAESDETVTIGLANVPTNSTFDNTLASITIKDNDTVVQVAAASPNGSESASTPIVFRFTRNGDVRSQLTVNYSVNASPGPLNSGGTPTTFGDGSVRTISDGTSNTISVGGTISVSDSSSLATSGIDFNQLPGTITFQVGETSKELRVTPIDDSQIESKESVTIAIQRSQLYTLGTSGSATGFIEDNDQALALVSLSATQAAASEEGPTNGVFTVTRSVATPQPLAVFYSINAGSVLNPATNGTDFERLPGEIVIPANATSVNIVVKPIIDKEVEPEERVVLQLSTATPATYTFKIGANQATVVIKDNPKP